MFLNLTEALTNEEKVVKTQVETQITEVFVCVYSGL